MKKRRRRPSEQSIRRKAFLYSCESVPSVLITTILSMMPKSYLDKDAEKKIKEIAESLNGFLTETRMRLPNMSILEWYEIALVCMKESSVSPISEIENSSTKTWIECRNKFKESLEFATRVIKSVKKVRKRHEIF